MRQSERCSWGIPAVVAILISVLSGCGDPANLGVDEMQLDDDVLRGATILPELTGQQLLDALVAGYKPRTVLSYKSASDRMFGDIDVHDGKLTCVYTGYSISVPSGGSLADAGEYASRKGINVEHTLPQSEGATGQAKSNMHHLFPTEKNVNSSRGNLPYAEIDDAQTDDWFIGTSVGHTVPTSNLEQYSERDNGSHVFEPRHEHKGNVARALFYMATMYRGQMNMSFFNRQKELLFQWHQLDPADEVEIERSERIAAYQDGKVNPFVVDPTLVVRAFFPNAAPPPSPAPVATVSGLSFAGVDASSMTLSWDVSHYDSSRNELLVLARADAATEDPTAQTIGVYAGNVEMGRGTKVGVGTYAILRGDGRSVTVTGLNPDTLYHFGLWLTDNGAWARAAVVGQMRTAKEVVVEPDPPQPDPPQPPPATGASLLIAEIMSHPHAALDAVGEWIELYNPTNTSVDINGWTLKDDGTDKHVISAGAPLLVPALGRLVLGINGDRTRNGGVKVDYVYRNFQLGNRGDEVILLDGSGKEIDRVEYDGGEVWPNAGGASMVFTGTPSDDNNDPAFWKRASAPWAGGAGDAGSPGTN